MLKSNTEYKEKENITKKKYGKESQLSKEGKILYYKTEEDVIKGEYK